MKLLLLVLLLAFAVAAEPGVEEPYLFTDELARLSLPEMEGEIACSVRLIDAGGIGETQARVLMVTDGIGVLAPLGEGIHVVTLPDGKELRFLAMTPPPPLDARVLCHALPRHGQRLLDGEAVRFLAMGDSVTATGDYEGILRRMLARATGNDRLEMSERAYSGRSVDASVRNFTSDLAAAQPHVAMIMYGLNDQGAGASLAGYLEQMQWLAKRLREAGVDPLFLLPTPDISQAKDETNYTPYIFRTVGYGAHLRELGARLGLPVVDSFNAIWGQGGADLQETGRSMQPFFPPHYRRPFSSMLETEGRGDGIHPNVLGHLMIARALYVAIATPATTPAEPPPRLQAVSRWTPGGMRTQITATMLVDGRMELYPLPGFELSGNEALTPAEPSRSLAWPQLLKADDLLRWPADLYLAPFAPMLIAIHYRQNGSRLQTVVAPFPEGGGFLRGRQVVAPGEKVRVEREDGTTLEVALPLDAEVGRIPLLEQLGPESWAAAEVAFVRFGAVDRGEVTVDGALNEWLMEHAFPVGEPVQARWTRGRDDHRVSPSECYLKVAIRAGEKGLYVAVRGTGQLRRDLFTFYFDPRAPELLGTPGGYYWLGGSFLDDGRLKLGPGETSARKVEGLAGAWRETTDGLELEIFVPYMLFAQERWPINGDLGFSLDWRHRGADGTPDTHLQWAEDGHPWSSLWYGVLRLTEDPATRPFRVRIK